MVHVVQSPELRTTKSNLFRFLEYHKGKSMPCLYMSFPLFLFHGPPSACKSLHFVDFAELPFPACPTTKTP